MLSRARGLPWLAKILSVRPSKKAKKYRAIEKRERQAETPQKKAFAYVTRPCKWQKIIEILELAEIARGELTYTLM
jgi:hypothetical protein